MRGTWLGLALVAAATLLWIGSEAATEAQAPRQPTSRFNDNFDRVPTVYANVVRMNGNPEELVVDFNFTTDPNKPIDNTMHVEQRIVMSYYTAKRMQEALDVTLTRYEQAFGPIELDPNKRVKKPGK